MASDNKFRIFSLTGLGGVGRRNIAFDSRVSKQGVFVNPRRSVRVRDELTSAVTVTFSRYIRGPTSCGCTGRTYRHAAE